MDVQAIYESLTFHKSIRRQKRSGYRVFFGHRHK